MMQAFRSSAKIIAAVFALLMIVFVLTSVDWGTFGQARSAGEINGETVDLRAYETAVQQQIEAVQQQSPRSLSLEDIQSIRDQVWEQFIQNTVLEDEYERRDITASEDEIVEALRLSPLPEFYAAPEFQTDSQFDPAKYQRWLTSSVGEQYVPALAAQYREQIKQAKLFREITADIFLSDAELWQKYRDQHETVTIGLAAIIPRNAVPDSAVTVTPDDVQQYYREHREEFERPETAYLSYLALPRRTNAADTAAARARADTLRQEILGGAPFEEVARRESADTVSGNQGGDLGTWARGAMDPAFDSAAFALPLDKLSEPVLSQFGFHLIEVTRRQGDSVTGRHILVPIELAGAHRDRVDAQVDSLDQLAAERLDPAALDTAASALGLRLGQAMPVQEGSRAQVGRLVVPDAGIWAFRAQEGETSPIIETPYAFYVFRLDSLTPAGVPPLADIRGAVEQAVRAEKKQQAARPIADDYLARVKDGAAMDEVAESMGLAYREFGPFSRVNPPLTNPVVVGAAFGLEQGKRSGVIETDEGLYVLEVLGHTPADSAAFAKQLDQFRAQAVREAQQERIRQYITALRGTAEVEDYRARIRQTQAQADAALPL